MPYLPSVVQVSSVWLDCMVNVGDSRACAHATAKGKKQVGEYFNKSSTFRCLVKSGALTDLNDAGS